MEYAQFAVQKIRRETPKFLGDFFFCTTCKLPILMQTLPTRQCCRLLDSSGVLWNYFLSGKETARGFIRKRDRASPRFWMNASEL